MRPEPLANAPPWKNNARAKEGVELLQVLEMFPGNSVRLFLTPLEEGV